MNFIALQPYTNRFALFQMVCMFASYRCWDLFFFFFMGETMHDKYKQKTLTETEKKNYRKHNCFWIICFCISFLCAERIHAHTSVTLSYTEPISIRFRWIPSRVLKKKETMGF